MTSAPSPSCDRSRALLSRALDAPLSELERRTVAVHIARCAGCSAFERESRWLTETLRSAPLAPLPRPLVVTFPRRRLPIRVVANVASAAALVAVAIGGASWAAQPPTGTPSIHGTALSSSADLRSGDPGLREIRRDGLRTGEIQVLPETDPPDHGKPALPAINP